MTFDMVESYGITPGVLSANMEDFFLFGQCWALAEVLAVRTGWTPVLWAMDEPPAWDHAVVRRPDGLMLDVRGLHEQEVVEDMGYATRDTAVNCFIGYSNDCWEGAWGEVLTFDEYRRQSLVVAESVADVVLEAGLTDRTNPLDTMREPVVRSYA